MKQAPEQTEPMRIIHLIDSGGLYGAEKMLLALCCAQKGQGLDVSILSCGVDSEGPKPLETEAEKYGINVIPWRMKPGLNVEGMAEIWKEISSRGITHVHSHGYKFNVLVSFTRQRYLNVRAISTVHGYTRFPRFSKGWVYQQIDKLALCRMDRVVFVNESTELGWLRRILYGRSVRYIPNGIELKSQNRKDHLSKPVRKLLIIGRLATEKGHTYALQALKKLIANDATYSLTIAGDGPLLDTIRSQIELLGLTENVSLLGFVENVDALYESHDALIMPSLTEGLPITLLEAFSHRLPVFSTPVGGIPAFFGTFGSTFLFRLDENGLEGLSALLEKWDSMSLLSKTKLFDEFAQRMESRYSIGAMSESYIECYRNE